MRRNEAKHARLRVKPGLPDRDGNAIAPGAMKRMIGLMLFVLTGCSTAPCADLLDACYPGRVEPGSVYGGVCNGPGCQPAGPPPTNFATGQADPSPPESPAITPANSAAKLAPASGTVPAPAMAPATGSWKRMMPPSETSSKAASETGP